MELEVLIKKKKFGGCGGLLRGVPAVETWRKGTAVLGDWASPGLFCSLMFLLHFKREVVNFCI